MYPHRIRLRGPWECEPLETVTDALPAPRRVTMPCHWCDRLPGFAGRMGCHRRFGYPGRIDANERVWLTFDGFSQRAEIMLNGQPLGSRTAEDCPCEFAITALLQPRNELVVTVESATDEGGLWGEVALEIRRTAFLRGVQAQIQRGDGSEQVHVTGQVVGTSAGPLDLYVLLEDRTVAYATVGAGEVGQPFELLSEPLERARAPDTRHLVRVELVEGGVIWYRLEIPCHL